MNLNITLVIQAGGFSTRMGQEKALLPFGGLPLIEFIVNRGKMLTDDLIITTNQPDQYEFLNLPLHPDILPQRGTLIGMYTALSAAQRPLVAVLGCDMPFFSPLLLAFQAEWLERSNFDAVIPRSTEGLEPLHGVYRREPCLNAIQMVLEKGVHSLIGWLKHLQIMELPEEQIHFFDPNSRAFINLNTPEDYQHAISLIKPDQREKRSTYL